MLLFTIEEFNGLKKMTAMRMKLMQMGSQGDAEAIH